MTCGLPGTYWFLQDVRVGPFPGTVWRNKYAFYAPAPSLLLSCLASWAAGEQGREIHLFGLTAWVFILAVS